MSDLNKRNEEIETNQEELAVSTNFLGKIVNIIVAPSKALKAIKKKPNIIIPMLLVSIIPALYYIIFWDSVEIQLIRVIEASFEMQGSQATQEMMDLAMPFLVFAPILIIAVLLFSGIFSATYYYICSKIAKSGMTFKESVSLAFHVMIIASLSWVLNMILTLVGIDFSMELPLTSLASMLPSSMNGTFLYGLALPVEVFALWGMVVTYFGLQIIAKMSKKAAAISVLIYLFAGMLYTGGSLALTNYMNSLF